MITPGIFRAFCDELEKEARYLDSIKHVSKPKLKAYNALPPNSKFKIKEGFGVSSYSGPMTEGPTAQRYSSRGTVDPVSGRQLYKTSGPPSEKKTDKEKKAGSAVTPAGRLRASQQVGLPKTTAAPGPSIAQISKPVGFGKPIPGATKMGAIDKEALIERLIRLGATDIPKTPRLFMRKRSPKELKALQDAVETGYDKRVTEPIMRRLKPLTEKLPNKEYKNRLKPIIFRDSDTVNLREKGTAAAKLLAEDPVGGFLAGISPVPASVPTYFGAKKGLEKIIDRAFPLPA